MDGAKGHEVTAWLCAECLGQIGAGPPRACNKHPFAGQLKATAIVASTEPWRDPYPSSFRPIGRHHPDRETVLEDGFKTGTAWDIVRGK